MGVFLAMATLPVCRRWRFPTRSFFLYIGGIGTAVEMHHLMERPSDCDVVVKVSTNLYIKLQRFVNRTASPWCVSPYGLQMQVSHHLPCLAIDRRAVLATPTLIVRV